jgi:glycine/D-amino acid oxidase-like deaminating enzyme
MEDARSQLHYYRLTADNRILMGGGNIGPILGRKLDYDSNKKVFAHLEQHVINVFPQLSGLRFTHHWGGPVSIAIDTVPVIGYSGRKKRALFSLGLMGHGVSMAPYNGLCYAELLADQKSERTEMFFVGRRTIPWPPHAIRFPLLHCVRGLLKLEDRVLWD